MQLKDNVLIITGGCQGLGRAMAEYLAAKGAKLALVDLNQEKLDEAVAACKAAGGDARAYLCNVANEEQVTHMVAQVAEDFGAINGLVNNAGILRDGLTIKIKDGEMTKMSLAQWQSVIDVNLTGVYRVVRRAVRGMVKQRFGRIVGMSSVVALLGSAGQVNYASSKAGLIGMARSVAREVGSRGITFNVITPGFIQTAMTDVLDEATQKSYAERIPVGRMGTIDDVANAVKFLVSDETGYITGAVIPVDGGLGMGH